MNLGSLALHLACAKGQAPRWAFKVAQGHCAKLWGGQLASYSAFTCPDKQGEALVIHRLRGDAEPSSGAGNGQLLCLHPAWT